MGQARAAVAGSLHGRERQDAQHRLLRGGGRARGQRGHPQRGPRREAANEPRRRDGRAGGEVWPSQRARPLRCGSRRTRPAATLHLGVSAGTSARATVEGLLQGRERQAAHDRHLRHTGGRRARLQRRDPSVRASKAAARRTRLTGNWCEAATEAAVAQAPPRRVDRRPAATAPLPPPLRL